LKKNRKLSIWEFRYALSF